MEHRNLTYSEEQQVGTISFNQPERRNALSLELLQELTSLLTRIGEEKPVKAVIVQGRGKHFCSGHDLGEVRNWQPQEVRSLFRACYRTMRAIREIPQPVVAQVHGVATAAGCQLVASCDLAVAAEEARLATSGVNIGLFCSTPMVALSRNVARKAAMEMLLMGEFVEAERARELGLVNRVVPRAGLEEGSMEMARTIADKSPVAVKIGKRAFYEQAEMSLEEAYAYAGRVMAENMMARDTEAGIGAFTRKEPMPEWTGE